MKYLLTRLPAFLLASIVGLIAASSAFGTATIVILNNDAAGVGFNDPTVVAPVGGNAGTTLGEQRMIAFQAAANIWGATLVSGPTITIRASWSTTMTCTTTTATLGSAGNSGSIWRDLPGGVGVPGTWYGNALANALTNTDLNGATHEINATFNARIGTPGCLDTSPWYYGLDANEGPGSDLVAVVLHELGHGLGFQTFTSSTTGARAGDATNGFFPSIYDRFLLDNTTGEKWSDAGMTDAERVASAINTGNLVWNGTQATGDSTILTGGKDAQGHPLMFAPNPIQGGSSVSHWDSSATPNQLMEPNISRSLGHGVTVADNPPDLTFSLLRDIGWCAGCPQPPPPSPTPTPSPPPNNNFANAQALAGCSGSVNGTNVAATEEAGEPDNPVSPGSTKSVWYQWQAPSTGSVTIDTIGSNYDTILGVYTGSSLATLSLVPGGANDDIASGNTASRVTFDATAGTTYRIAVDGFENTPGSGGDTGSITLNWSESPCSATAPRIITEEGTNKAAAVDSVTLLRGPFKVINPTNFNTQDRLRRVILFTSPLGLTQPDPSKLTVTAGGVAGATPLTVEGVGTVTGVTGLSASYIVVRLSTNLPPGGGDFPLTVTLFGVASSNHPTLGISP